MNKKLVIIEGCDNTGKDTLISQLKTNFKNPVVIHAGVPPKNVNLFEYYYNGLIHDTLDAYYNKDVDCIIHNRSMYGEYVYGPKYRNENKLDVLKTISNLEIGQLKTFILSSKLYFILLSSTSTDLLVNNDDGKSLSAKKEDIQYEINAFNEIFELSNIENKLKVFVNDGNKFAEMYSIYRQVCDFINL